MPAYVAGDATLDPVLDGIGEQMRFADTCVAEYQKPAAIRYLPAVLAKGYE